MNVLEVRSVSKTYGSGEAAVHALKKASFCVPKGEFVAIVGESGRVASKKTPQPSAEPVVRRAAAARRDRESPVYASFAHIGG